MYNLKSKDENSKITIKQINEAENFWQNLFPDIIEEIKLPTIKNKKSISKYGIYEFSIKRKESQKIELLSRKDPYFAYSLFIAIYDILFFLLSGQKNIINGIPSDFKETNKVNISNIPYIVLPVYVLESFSLQYILSTVRETLTKCYYYQYYSIAKIKKMLNIDDKVNLRRFMIVTKDIYGTSCINQFLNAENDLSVNICFDNIIKIQTRFDIGLFDESIIIQLSKYIQFLVEKFLHNGLTKISDITLPSDISK